MLIHSFNHKTHLHPIHLFIHIVNQLFTHSFINETYFVPWLIHFIIDLFSFLLFKLFSFPTPIPGSVSKCLCNQVFVYLFVHLYNYFFNLSEVTTYTTNTSKYNSIKENRKQASESPEKEQVIKPRLPIGHTKLKQNKPIFRKFRKVTSPSIPTTYWSNKTSLDKPGFRKSDNLLVIKYSFFLKEENQPEGKAF